MVENAEDDLDLRDVSAATFKALFCKKLAGPACLPLSPTHVPLIIGNDVKAQNANTWPAVGKFFHAYTFIELSPNVYFTVFSDVSMQRKSEELLGCG